MNKEIIEILRKEAKLQAISAGDGCDSEPITKDILHWVLEWMLNDIADALESHLQSS